MKVLIADDEEKICQLIKNLVNWEELDMDVIACVNDGIAALDIIEHDKPDLVITDIRMPGYDGLELIKRTKTISPETEFIIISGYRHFEYAQNAIRYGVKNYLLKPVKKIELNEELEKIHNNYYLRIQKFQDIPGDQTKQRKNQMRISGKYFVKESIKARANGKNRNK
jgi:two-component system response regulator YesN